MFKKFIFLLLHSLSAPSLVKYGLNLFVSIILLSEVAAITSPTLAANPNSGGVKIAQNTDNIAAKKVFEDADKLREQGTAESFKQAIKKYEEALRLYRALGDRKGEAITLNNIGEVYNKLGERQKALDFHNQALPLRRAIGDRKGEAATLNNIGEVYDYLGERQKALDFYNQALPLSRAVGDRKGEAITINNIGVVYNKLGERQKALDFYNQSLPLRRTVGDRTGEAYTLSNIGAVYNALGERQKALEFYNQALPLSRAVGDRTGEAITLNNIGEVYNKLGERQKALDFYNQSLPLRRTVGDRTGEAYTLSNIGAVYNALGERQKALEFYNQALPLSRAVGDRTGEAATLINMGLVYNQLGERQKALDFYNQALLLKRAVGDRTGEAIALNNIGIVYYYLGERQKALDFFNQSLPLKRAVGDRKGEAITLNNIGLIYYKLGESQKALDFFNQTLPIKRAVGDRAGEATTLSNIGAVYNALGERQKALDLFNQALPLKRAVGDRAGEAITLNNIGAVYNALGEKQKALDFHNQALPISRAVGDKAREAKILYNIAEVERDRGNFEQALTQIEASLQIIDSLRIKVASLQLRASYFATVQDYYQFYIDLQMQLHKTNPLQGYDGKALAASEKARARTLLDVLNESNTDIRTGVDPKLLEQERKLQQQLSAKEQQRVEILSSEDSDAQNKAIDTEIANLLTQYQDIQTQIRATSPRYAALTQPKPLNLQEIQQQVLDENTLLLEYSLGEKRSYLWAVTKTGITSYELPKRADIEELAKRFQQEELVAAHRRIKKPENARASIALSRILLQPVAQLLGNKRLVIVSDGALQYIPFAALPISTGEGEGKYLIFNHEIVSLPSASTLAVLRRDTANRKTFPKTVALIADPIFSIDDDRLQTVAKSNQPNNSDIQILALSRSASKSDVNLTRIPYTRDEVDAIMALLPAQEAIKVLNFDASRTAAISPDLAQYKIVHFATHGILNSSNPELSGIVLSLFDRNGNPQNGFLRLHDIYNLNLPVELVVLSACQTGLGQDIKGEGLVGLTRGFMYAGAPRVVVSLWNVNDQATAELMKRFYKKMLSEKLKPAAALRAAQIEMLQTRWKAPYYWSAFILQGEWK